MRRFHACYASMISDDDDDYDDFDAFQSHVVIMLAAIPLIALGNAMLLSGIVLFNHITSIIAMTISGTISIMACVAAMIYPINDRDQRHDSTATWIRVNGQSVRIQSVNNPLTAHVNNIHTSTLMSWLTTKLRCKTRLNTPLLHANISSLPKLKPDEIWMVCDSCANQHYLPETVHRRYMLRIEQAHNDIGRLTGSGQASTTHFGLFAVQVEDENKRWHDLTSVAFAVRDAEVGLFSEVQASIAGNTVIRSGDPFTGRHGLLLQDNSFIPFHFDREQRLWYIRVHEATRQHAFEARALDPRDMVDD